MPMVTRPHFLPGLPRWSRKTFFALALFGICFAFAFPVLWLILTGNRVPMITVVMAQFVTEMGLRWNLMAATAVMALVPAFLLALFGQKYVIRGLRI